MDPVVPFDPTVPLDYRKLGGEIPHQTPHQYSWLTTFILSLYRKSGLKRLINFIHKHFSAIYSRVISTIVHFPVKVWYSIPDTIREFPFESMIPVLRPILFKIFTFPQYFAYNYPSTTSLLFATLLSYLVLFDYETDVKHTPFFPIYDKSTELGKAIETGRKIRRMLGGRTFLQYQREKLALGEATPTKQQFVEKYGAFVDETEWNQHYNYHDDKESHVIYSTMQPLTQDDLETQLHYLRHKQRLALLDERFRQKELLAQRRLEVRDQIYNKTNWDLRDGSILPPSMSVEESEKEYKPWVKVPQNEDNPIPHDTVNGSLDTKPAPDEPEAYFDPDMDDYRRIHSHGEFTYELTNMWDGIKGDGPGSYKPRTRMDKVRPHLHYNEPRDPWEALNHSLLRTLKGRVDEKGEDEKLISRITAMKKKHLLGVYDGQGAQSDNAADYIRAKEGFLQDDVRQHHRRVQRNRIVDKRWDDGSRNYEMEMLDNDDAYDFE